MVLGEEVISDWAAEPATGRHAPAAPGTPRREDSREIGAREIGAREVGAREVGAREVGAREVGAREIGAREIGAREKWVVVGHGMVAQRFCERVVEMGLLDRISLTVIGEEATEPYDRVHLTEALRTGLSAPLILCSSTWFEEHGIHRRRDRVHAIDRGARTLLLQGGETLPYERLVLATGSRPTLPPVPGCSDRHVYVYRSLADALGMRTLVLSKPEASRSALVVGAGLLGLEVTEALIDLGCRVQLVEADDHLLPKQLDGDSSRRLQALLEARGFTLRLATKVQSIRPAPGGEALEVTASDGSLYEAGLVVFAVGVRPRDELARAAGLHCDLFGGIVVNDALQTSDPRVFAVGECARFAGQSFGLVAPGYAMVDVLADRIAGRSRAFEGWQPSVRLKLQGAHLSAMGESSAAGVGLTTLVRERGDDHVRLVLHRSRITGLTAIGSPEDLPLLQQTLARGERLSWRARRRFEKGLLLRDAAGVDLATWPPEATVCNCTGVSCGALRDACARGARTLDTLMAQTSAGTVCGGCRPLLATLVGTTAPASGDRAARIGAACGALVLTALLALPPLPLPTSVAAATRLERLAEHLATFSGKQLSGWTLLALLCLAGVYGARRRLPRAWLGPRFRTAHIALGVGVALLLVAHTGLRSGTGLDHALWIVMVLTLLAGSLASVVAAGTRTTEPSPRAGTLRAGTLRAGTLRAHFWLTLPLPVLVLLHVLKVYWF